jgi:hypothetical protein
MNRAVALLLLLLLSGVARAQPVPLGPPDPRHGERLDGRPAPEDPMRGLRAVGSGALAVPRTLIKILAWPVVRLAAYVERHHTLARIYWTFTSEDRLVGLRPEARYETGLLSSIGLRFFDRRTLGRGSLIELLARSAGPRFVFSQLRLRVAPASRLALELRTLFERNAHQLFAGTHGEHLADLVAEGRGLGYYDVERALSEVHVEVQLGPLRAALGLGIDLRKYASLDSLDRFYCAQPNVLCAGVDDAIVPGFHEGLRLVRGDAHLLLDTRHGARRVGGVRLEVDGALAHGLLGDPSAHASIDADARLVLDLSDRALIVRVNAGLVAPLGDAPVPFDELMSPSGNEGLRGLPGGRLRGRSQLFGSIEYRWLLAPYLDAALFIDRGGAFDRLADVSLASTIPSYGFGLRIHQIRADYWNAAPLLWLQVAHAPGEGTRLILSLGGGD